MLRRNAAQVWSKVGFSWVLQTGHCMLLSAKSVALTANATSGTPSQEHRKSAWCWLLARTDGAFHRGGVWTRDRPSSRPDVRRLASARKIARSCAWLRNARTRRSAADADGSADTSSSSDESRA